MLNRRLDTVLAALQERGKPKPVRRLPVVFLTSDEQDWPGCQETNRAACEQAALLGIGVKAYQGIGPDEDGSQL